MANDGCKPSAGNRRSADLSHSARLWMTPTARDHKDGATSLANTPVNGLLGRQVLVTQMAGRDTSDARRILRNDVDAHWVASPEASGTIRIRSIMRDSSI
jgi:hypothetical protein